MIDEEGQIIDEDIVCQACMENRSPDIITCQTATWMIRVPESLHPDCEMAVCDEHDDFIRHSLLSILFLTAGVSS